MLIPGRAFWPFAVLERAQVNHAVKSGVAAALAVLGHQLLLLPDKTHPAWAAASALIVMQSNLGGSWKASGQRLLGTAVGALTGGLFTGLLGVNVVWLGAAVCVTLLVCSGLGLRESLRLAGVTLVLVMLSGQETSPWAVAGQRFLDVVLGILSALLTQTIIWPSRAGAELRQELGRALAACGRFYRSAVEPCLKGTCRPQDLDESRAGVRRSLLRIQVLVGDWQSEPMRQRAEDRDLAALGEQIREIWLHLLAADRAAAAMTRDTFYRKFQTPLGELAETTGTAFDWLAVAVTSPRLPDKSPVLDQALAALEREYDRLWEARTSSAFATEEILRFCAFFFNLKEVTQGLRAMERAIAGGTSLRPPDADPSRCRDAPSEATAE
jgi:uncharacterized membrane protein YccC